MVFDDFTGAFIGVSLEGNIVTTRMDANLRFYGDPYLTTSDILMGNLEQPNAAKFLYQALDDLYSGLDFSTTKVKKLGTCPSYQDEC